MLRSALTDLVTHRNPLKHAFLGTPTPFAAALKPISVAPFSVLEHSVGAVLAMRRHALRPGTIAVFVEASSTNSPRSHDSRQ
jgi:hypothetical protein